MHRQGGRVVSLRYGRWMDAMVTQSYLLDWSMSPQGLRYLEFFFEDMNSKRPDAAVDVTTLARIQLMSLQGEPTYVSHDACELIGHAMPSFEPEPVLATDPWVPDGFAVLAQPLYVTDAPITKEAPGRSPTGWIPVRAIAWMSVHNEDATQGCFWISYYVAIDDELKHAQEGGFDEDRWKGMEEDMRREMPLSLAHQWQWTWGTSATDLPPNLGRDEDPEDVGIRARDQARLIQVLWRLGSQFKPAKETPPRGIRRDAKRKGLDHRDVTVIRLRRAHGETEHDSTGKTYHVQFIVRGYWAKRYTKDGPRQTWVRPHLKGPEDAELKVTDRVWEFTR